MTTDDVVLNRITSDDVWSWLAAGWVDLKRGAPYSIAYGVVFVAGGFAITWGLVQVGLSAMIPMAAGGFALVAPLLAIGLYEISRRLEEGEPLSWRSSFFVRTRSPSEVAMIGFVLLALFLIWSRAAQILYALFTSEEQHQLGQFLAFALGTPSGLAMTAIGSAIGGVIALIVFAVSAISLPLVMRREVDAVSAVAMSIRAVRQQPGPMLLWGWLIAVITGAGIVTGFLGLVIAFPLLGHATWHAYRSLVPRAT